MLAQVVEHWLLAAVVAAGLPLAGYLTWARATDARFGIKRTGGRGGWMSISFPTYVAKAEFEVGATVDLIVYAESFVDGEGHPLPSERQPEVLVRLRAWGKARRLSLDVPGHFTAHECAA